MISKDFLSAYSIFSLHSIFYRKKKAFKFEIYHFPFMNGAFHASLNALCQTPRHREIPCAFIYNIPVLHAIFRGDLQLQLIFV